jgi:hypothetical protein
MTKKDKILNIYLAFKFAILDNAYTESEILKIIKTSDVLSNEVGEKYAEEQLSERISPIFENGEINVATKILIELLREKKMTTDLDYGRTLKTLDTLLWLNGLEEERSRQIEELIYYFEDEENSNFTESVKMKILDCLKGYENYNIKNYLSQ